MTATRRRGLALLTAASLGAAGWLAYSAHIRARGPAPGVAAPYPRSAFVTSLAWEQPPAAGALPSSGDNWPATWGIDGNLYTAYGDGAGFGGARRLSLGLAEVSGNPFAGTMAGRDIASNIDAVGGSKAGLKASGLLMVGGVLYLFVRNYRVDGDYRHSRLAFSADNGQTWTWASWYFSDTFGAPSFVQYGPGYAGGDRRYVYVVSQANNDAYLRSPDIVLARVPRGKIAVRRAYRFFSGTAARPRWSKDIGRRTPVFHDANGVYRVAMSYNSGLHRYFLTSSHGDGGPAAQTGALGVFDAPAPWGPWRTDYYASGWATGESYGQQFPPKYMSSDGRTMWMLYSGQRGTPYQFTLRRAVLTITGTIRYPARAGVAAGPRARAARQGRTVPGRSPWVSRRHTEWSW